MRQERVRVLMVSVPHDLRCNVIRTVLETRADVDVVGDVATDAWLSATVDRTRPELVITHLEGTAFPGRYEDLLRHHPRLRVLGIRADLTEGQLYELRPQVIPTGELSREKLVEVIHGVTSEDIERGDG